MNLVFGNRVFRTFKFLCIVGLFGVFLGCRSTNQTLDSFSKLEMEASKHGTVSVGAVRVVNYDRCELREARKRLQDSLMRIRKELKKKPVVPEGYVTNLSDVRRILDIGLTLGGKSQSNILRENKGQTSPKKTENETKNKPSKEGEGLSQIVDTITASQTPQPSEIDMIGLRMAALKFIESELEDVDLGKIFPVKPNYRRVVISLDCSAWVRGKAGAALVYIDLYPYNADSWCHKAAEILEEWWKEAKDNRRSTNGKGGKCEEDWKKVLKQELGDAFPPKFLESLRPPRIKKCEDPEDWVARCHIWLEKNKLRPRIIHVERMGKAEYLILAEADYLSSEFGIGAALPAGLSAEMGVEKRKEIEQLKASVRPLSLAFVAGDRRAGWLFMPSKTREGRMPPTERRLRMVVDIPRRLSKLGIHIHKVFLGPDLGILSDAAFANQMANLSLARQKLSEAEQEQFYEKYKGRHWRLIKSRMRNLLYQGWSEEIVVDVDIPSLNVNHEKK